MAEDKGEQQGGVWPLPKFYFSVQFGDDMEVKFQEVSGLESETKPIEYRHGNSPIFYPIKMPGLGRVGNVTMRKGIFINDQKFWSWFSEIKMNTVSRRTVVVKLLDQSAAPTMVWRLHNAWPTKITSTDLKSEGNEAAIETLELAFESMEIEAS
jgi:phage tail-like protein